MKSIIIYYSHTGNNALIAEEVSKELGIDAFRLNETTERNTKKIMTDMIFHRKSQFTELPKNIEEYDLVIFIGPVWMFNIPSPLKTYFKLIKKKISKYAFISLTGGALGPNTGIAKQLVKRLGKGLTLNLDLNIANFCSVPKKANTDDTGNYLLADNPDDLNRITSIVSTVLSNLINR